mgnify:CR=1 FL=1
MTNLTTSTSCPYIVCAENAMLCAFNEYNNAEAFLNAIAKKGINAWLQRIIWCEDDIPTEILVDRAMEYLELRR